MVFPEQPAPRPNERRAMPRHLRDGEHEDWGEAAIADARPDAAPARSRGRWAWIALLALGAAAAVWWWM
jgi:hypothetical protein